MTTFLRLLVVCSFLATGAKAQTDLWKHVSLQPGPRPARLTVSKVQIEAVKKALKENGGSAWQPCDITGDDGTESLIFEELPLSPTEKTMVVEAGQGCARGGQGANGAMWVIRFEGDKPVVLATPGQKFNGWLYSVQPTSSHGLRDIVLGWHIGAFETDLSYFRFDGTIYRQVSTAKLVGDTDGNAKIVAE